MRSLGFLLLGEARGLSPWQSDVCLCAMKSSAEMSRRSIRHVGERHGDEPHGSPDLFSRFRLGAFQVAHWQACILALAAYFATCSARAQDSVAKDAAAAFQRGVDAKDRLLQARKEFSRATDLYLSMHHEGYRSVALYRNCGNAAALADRWPEAIWAYQMGLTLHPNDRDLRENLAHARSKVLYAASGQGRLPMDNWPAWLHRPTIGELFCGFAICYAGAWIAAMLALVMGRSCLFFITSVFCVTALALGIGIWLQVDRIAQDRATPIAVVSENTPLYRGNGVSYPQHTSLPMLPRGLEVRVVHARGAWKQVRLATGEIGWLPRGRVLIVEP